MPFEQRLAVIEEGYRENEQHGDGNAEQAEIAGGEQAEESANGTEDQKEDDRPADAQSENGANEGAGVIPRIDESVQFLFCFWCHGVTS